MGKPSDLIQGTLDLLILKTVSLEPKHGWAIAKRIQQVSQEALQVTQGSLYPALHRLEQQGWLRAKTGDDRHRAGGEVLCPHPGRQEAARARARELGSVVGRDRPGRPRRGGLTCRAPSSACGIASAPCCCAAARTRRSPARSLSTSTEATREHIARGLSPAEARLAARRDFGTVAVIEEQCRDTRRVALYQSLLQDLRYGMRALLAQPLVLLAATASIGAGAGATALVINLASELLLARPTVRDADTLVNITLDNGSHVSYADWRALDESGVLAGLAGYHIEGSVNLRQGERTEALVPMLATANFFDVLGVPMALGRGFTAVEAAAEREPRVAVISDRFWRVRLGADPRAVGRAIVVNGESYTILGVLPPKLKAIAGFGLAPELYLPAQPRAGARPRPSERRRGAARRPAETRHGPGTGDCGARDGRAAPTSARIPIARVTSGGSRG